MRAARVGGGHNRCDADFRPSPDASCARARRPGGSVARARLRQRVDHQGRRSGAPARLRDERRPGHPDALRRPAGRHWVRIEGPRRPAEGLRRRRHRARGVRGLQGRLCRRQVGRPPSQRRTALRAERRDRHRQLARRAQAPHLVAARARVPRAPAQHRVVDGDGQAGPGRAEEGVDRQAAQAPVKRLRHGRPHRRRGPAGGLPRRPADPAALPGRGLRLQPLANFGKANALYNACRVERGQARRASRRRCAAARPPGHDGREARRLHGLGVLLPVRRRGAAVGQRDRAGHRTVRAVEQRGSLPRAERAGAAARARLGRRSAPAPGSSDPGSSAEPDPAEQPPDPEAYLAVARAAFAAYKRHAPVGIQASASRGPHFLIYSFSPGLRVANAFIQSLNGLYDYSQATGDRAAKALFTRAEREARRELRLFDTGAWSLYSLGGAESDLNYHRVLRDFMRGLCDRTKASVWCDASERFTRYLEESPSA